MEHIRPLCTRVVVAGSVRRGNPEVKDIEIVCIPKTGEQIMPVLIGEVIRKSVNFLDDYMKDLMIQDVVKADRISKDGKRAPFGPRYYRITYMFRGVGCPIDLFAVLPPADWGVILAIRTGPAEYSKWLVTEALKRGYKVQDGQLFKMGNRQFVEPALKNPVVYEESVTKIPCPEEYDFFNVLGVEWVPPEKRSIPVGH